MAKFKLKPLEVDAITFDELVEHAKNNSDHPHWSFDYKGLTITHEDDVCYLIPTEEGNFQRFTPTDMLITGVMGNTFPLDIDAFNNAYEKS